MDLKALMQKLDTINKTEILTESEKKETTWTDKSGKKHPATQVKGDKYTGKEAEKESKPKKDDLDEQFNSAIAKALVEEFGYEIDEAEVTSGSGAPVTSGSGAPVTTAAPQGAPATPGNGPWPAGSPQATAWAALTPEDQKWLGGADPTDQFILARAPNKGKPAATGAATKPADDRNEMDKASDAATAAGAATKPAAVDPAVAATREKFKALMDKLEKTGGVSGAAAAPAAPAAGAATKPATKPAAGAATKPAAGGATMPAVDAMGNVTGVQENVAYEDDRILLAIKNIQY